MMKQHVSVMLQVLTVADSSTPTSYADYSHSAYNRSPPLPDENASAAGDVDAPHSMAAMLSWAGTSVKQLANKLLGGGALSPQDASGGGISADGCTESEQEAFSGAEGSQHGATLAALHRQTSASKGMAKQQLGQQTAGSPFAMAAGGADMAAPQEDCFDQEAAFTSTVRRLTTEVRPPAQVVTTTRISVSCIMFGALRQCWLLKFENLLSRTSNLPMAPRLTCRWTERSCCERRRSTSHRCTGRRHWRWSSCLHLVPP